MYDVATQAKILEWRRRAIEGTLSVEDKIESVRFLMQGRRAAFEAAAGAKSTRGKAAKGTAAVAAIDADADLEAMMRGDLE